MREIEGKFGIDKNFDEMNKHLIKYSTLEKKLFELNYVKFLFERMFRFRKNEEGYFFTFKGKDKEEEYNNRLELEFKIPKIVYKILTWICFKEPTYIKKRNIYSTRKGTLFLDEILKLGCFVEIEGKEKDIYYWESKLKLENCIKESYAQMMKEIN